MKQWTIGILAGATGLVAPVIQFASVVVFSGDGNAIPGWIPMIGTVGETVTIYLYVFEIVGSLALFGLPVSLGYAAGREFDLPEEYPKIAATVVVGSTVAGLLGGIVAMIVSGGGIAGFAVPVLGLLRLRYLAEFVLPIAIGALAGASLAHVRSTARRPGGPRAARTDTSTADGGPAGTSETDTNPPR